MGGIGFITEVKAEVMRDNVLINVNMVEASRLAGVKKIFYSFDQEYPKTKKYIKTTSRISSKKKLPDTDKFVIFSPNRNISNCI